MPLIQDVVAEDQTAAELSNTIHQSLLAYIKDPQVSVIVLRSTRRNISSSGTWRSRGHTPCAARLRCCKRCRWPRFTQFASRRSIKLIRKNAGKQEVRKINYNNMIEETGEGNYLLKSGDTIVVP